MAAGSRLAFLAVFAALLCAMPAHAQQLARLHVLDMTLSSSTAHPRAGAPFDLILTIRVRENLNSLDNVVLPSFVGPEELGDERVVSHGARGTLYRETLRLVAHSRGALAIGPAYLDAIDARDGKPKRFLSNALQLDVKGGSLFDPWNGVRRVFAALGELLAAITVIAALAVVLRRRPRAAAVQSPAGTGPMPAAPVPLAIRLRDAFEALQANPDREPLRRVRALLWERAGAPPGGTLADAFAANSHASAHECALLTAVERAMFVEDERFGPAVARVLQLAQVTA